MAILENQLQLDSEIISLPVITESVGYFGRLEHILRRLPHEVVDQTVVHLLRAYDENRTLFTFGNGGSASLASHLVCDLGKGTSVPGLRRFRAISLTDNIPMMTAWANDLRYEEIFSEQLKNLATSGDIVLAISGSGNSPNVLRGLQMAREVGCYVIGLTGFEGGKMKNMCDLCLVVPSDNMQFIEDVHVCVSHCVFTAMRHQISLRCMPENKRMTIANAAD